MVIRNWCSSDGRTIQLGRWSSGGNGNGNGSSKMKWKMLWMKFKKEKNRLLQASTPRYDPHTYSQNFDQGTALDEPDNLSRSFSARFADPSIMHLKKMAV